MDASGNVYVVTRFGHVRKYTNDGTLLTQWNVGDRGFGIAVDAARDAYATNNTDGRVRKFTGDGPC